MPTIPQWLPWARGTPLGDLAWRLTLGLVVSLFVTLVGNCGSERVGALMVALGGVLGGLVAWMSDLPVPDHMIWMVTVGTGGPWGKRGGGVTGRGGRGGMGGMGGWGDGGMGAWGDGRLARQVLWVRLAWDWRDCPRSACVHEERGMYGGGTVTGFTLGPSTAASRVWEERCSVCPL
jgi:hypothetical protein